MKTTFNLKRAAGIALGYMLTSIILAEFYPLFKSLVMEGKTWGWADYIHQLEIINWVKILFRSAFVGLVVILISVKTSPESN